MITITLPLLKLWFWIGLTGLAVMLPTLVYVLFDLSKHLRRPVSKQVEAWRKQSEGFK